MFFSIKQILKGFLLWILYYLYKPYREQRKAEAQRRIAICENCEYFYKSFRNCSLCGCFCDIKSKMWFPLDEDGKSIGGCLKRYW